MPFAVPYKSKITFLSAVVTALLVSACGGGKPHSVERSPEILTPIVAAPSPPPKPLSQAPATTPDNIAAWGHSLTPGYANQLKTIFAERTAFNGGVGGQTSTQIAARQGAVVPLISIDSDTIPATGPVKVTFRSVTPITNQGGGPLKGVLNGVPGELIRATDDTYSFMRLASGSPIDISQKTPYIIDTFGRNSRVNLFWFGRNNYGQARQSRLTLPLLSPS